MMDSHALSSVSPESALPNKAVRLASLRADLREITQLMREQKAWLWLLVPYFGAWIVPVYWSRHEWTNPNHSFSFQPFVFAGALLIAWSQRKEIAQKKARFVRKWKARDGRLQPSVILLVVGLGLFLFSHIVQVKGFIFLSLWLIGVGVLWQVYNALTVGLLWKPLAFALLFIPPPDSLIDRAALRTKEIAISGAAFLLRRLHLAGDAVGAGQTLQLKGSGIFISSACSGINTVLPLCAFFLCYLLCVKAPPLRGLLLMVLGGIAGFIANVGRIMLIGLLFQSNPDMAQTLNTGNTYIVIVPLLLVMIAADRRASRKMETNALASGTMRVAVGAGVVTNAIFAPLNLVFKGLEGAAKGFKKSERGLEKLLSKLLPKKKRKRNRW